MHGYEVVIEFVPFSIKVADILHRNLTIIKSPIKFRKKVLCCLLTGGAN